MKINIKRRTPWLVLALAAAIVAGSAYASTGSSGSSSMRDRTIRLLEASEVPQLEDVDVGDPGLSVGDHVVTTDNVLRPNGAVAGTMSEVCTVVKIGSNLFTSTFDCSGSFDLADGSITMQGSFVPVAPENSFAVTGGTGEFRGAEGDGVIRAEADEITIKLM